jgi:hypothetical protein
MAWLSINYSKATLFPFILIVLLVYLKIYVITGSSMAQLSNTPTTSVQNNTNNSKCTIPFMVNSNSIEPKVRVLPPKIVMIYAGKEYDGELSDSKYREGQTISELHIPLKNVSTDLPSKMVQVKEGSCLQFVIKGTPRLLPPSSLAVTAYDSNNGTAVKVLSAVDSHSSIFKVILNKGNYIYLAVATWLPGTQHVSGYVIYKFMVNVIL